MKTTRIFLISALIAITAGLAQAQVPAPKFGIKGGINLANLRSGDDATDENLKVGLNLGLMAKMPVTNGFAIQPELLYSSQGSRVNYNNFIAGKGEYRFNLNYVQVPVLAVINLGEYFNIHAGPYASFLTSANVKDVNNNGTVENIRDYDVDNFNRFDYGVAGGVAFESNGFTLGARYNYGMKEIGKSGNTVGNATRDLKNNFGTIYIGFTF